MLMLELLLDAGYDVNTVDDLEDTLAHCAVWAGHVLTERGCNVDAEGSV